MVRERPAGVVATFVALWFAVAVVTACGAMLESGIRFHGSVQRYAAAPVLVAETQVSRTTGSGEDRDTESEPLAERGRLDSALVTTIGRLPGVRAAIGDVTVPAGVIGPTGVVGVEVHPWSAAALTPFVLRTGTPPVAGGDIVLDQSLAARIGAAPGTRVTLNLATGPRTFTIGGVAAPPTTEPAEPTVFVADADATALSGHPGTVEVIGVLPDAGVDTNSLAASVRASLPRLPARLEGAYPRVFTGADRGSVESMAVDNAREFVIAVSSVFGGITLLISTLVIAGTVGLSVRQRHRDIALLRAIAATPRQVRRMVVVESFLVSVVAATAAIWAGMTATGWLRDQFVSRAMVPDAFHAHLSWLPPLVAAAAASLFAVLAAWVASLRASRIRPVEALAETSVERRGIGVVRALLGIVALAGGIVLAVTSASASGDSAASISVATVATLVAAIGLLGPLVIRAAAATVGRVLHSFGVTGRLAVANTASSARQLAAVVSSLVLAVALGGSLWFLQTSEQHTAAGQVRAGLTADYVVTPASTGIPAGATDALRQISGVRAVAGVVHSTMFAKHDDITDYSAAGLDVADIGSVLNLGVTSGRLDDLRGDTIAIDALTATSLHLRVGGEFVGWFGDGAPARLRVVATYSRGLGFAALTLPHDLLIAHTTSGVDDSVLIDTGSANAATVAALRSALGPISPGATVVGSTAYRASLDEDLVQNAWTNRVVTAVLIVYVSIAAANTLVTYALGRRRQFAVLRLSGTTRIQVLRMVRLEQVLLLGIAFAAGIAIAAATLLPMVKGTTGSATPYIPLVGWVAVIGGTVALSAVATMVPVRRTLRMAPVEAIGVRE